jgi:abortive infection bacteriophage resistance protein
MFQDCFRNVSRLCIIAVIKSTTPLIQGQIWWAIFFMAIYKQPALTLEQQIQSLKEKGLIITNVDEAIYWLSHVSYFRLKNYTYTFKDYHGSDGNFVPNTTFQQVVDLYLFDRRLKLILFDAIEIIEVGIKTLLSNTMSCAYSVHWYTDRSHFGDKFEFDKFMASIQAECEQPEEPALLAYKKIYTDSPMPPSWMVMEFSTFGTISKIFEHTTARAEKLEICARFNIPDTILISWLHCFTFIRNKCAHHSRVVYRSVKHEPVLPSRRKHVFLKEVDEIERSSLYCVLCCMQYLVDKINRKSTFKHNLIALIRENQFIDYKKMGFTNNWRDEAIWQ